VTYYKCQRKRWVQPWRNHERNQRSTALKGPVLMEEHGMTQHIIVRPLRADISATISLQVTYYEFHKEEVDAAMEGHRKNQRSLSHVPSRVENKEAFNILMVSRSLLMPLMCMHAILGLVEHVTCSWGRV